MTPIATTIESTFNLPRQTAFVKIVPIDLRSIFTGFGPLPAVTEVKGQSGGWNMEGETRSVILSDGSSAKEKLTRYDYSKYFSYSIGEFTGILGLLALSAHGEWWFETVTEKQTQVRWRYAFLPRTVFAIPLLWLITNTLWRCYMKKALALSKNHTGNNKGVL